MNRSGKLSARWNRAFIVLLGLSVATAVLSVTVVRHVESSFAVATDDVTQETAMYDRLVSALTLESSTAHAVLDLGARASDDFLVADRSAGTAFAEAAAIYDPDRTRPLKAGPR